MSFTRRTSSALILATVLLASTFQPSATAGEGTAASAELAAPLILTPHRLGTLKLGASAEEAVGSGYLIDNPEEPCGYPAEVISKYASVLFVGWKDDDSVDNILIKGRSVARTKTGVGVRSTVAEMRAGHQSLRPARRVDGDGGRLWVQALRRGRDWLIFGLSTPENRQPRDTDRVSFIFIDRDWAPRDGLHGGC
ncbi:MAG: hypothetical protein LH477_04030 [Nocardioides sp.]|nr:hypothetical protein [Nocardioides sp.]